MPPLEAAVGGTAALSGTAAAGSAGTIAGRQHFGGAWPNQPPPLTTKGLAGALAGLNAGGSCLTVGVTPQGLLQALSSSQGLESDCYSTGELLEALEEGQKAGHFYVTGVSNTGSAFALTSRGYNALVRPYLPLVGGSDPTTTLPLQAATMAAATAVAVGLNASMPPSSMPMASHLGATPL